MPRRSRAYTKEKPYTIYDPRDGGSVLHSSVLEEGTDYTRVVVIDPGPVNCGFRIATRDNTTGVISTDMQTRLQFKKCKYEGCAEGKESVSYTNVYRVLDPYKSWFCMSHYILVEKQLKINYNLIRFGQHLITYMMGCTRNEGLRPIVVELDSRFKTRELGAPSGMKKRDIKGWAVVKSKEILLSRGDQKAYEALCCASKGDDIGDVVCYEEAFWSLLKRCDGIPKARNRLGV